MNIALADRPLWLLSWLVWRLIPGRGAVKLAEFSFTELGSGLDMLAAVEETPRREMRARYFQHALDELRHSELFRNRARAVGGSGGRAEAVLDDLGYIDSHGIRGKTSLFQQLGEREFLAFVWVAESRAAQQFGVYIDLLGTDPSTKEMFNNIARDERFHIAYSRAELDRMIAEGEGRAASWAVLRVRVRRLGEAWLRFSRVLGDVMSGLWLGIIYFIGVGPFAWLARRTERPKLGLLPVAAALPPRELAWEMG